MSIIHHVESRISCQCFPQSEASSASRALGSTVTESERKIQERQLLRELFSFKGCALRFLPENGGIEMALWEWCIDISLLNVYLHVPTPYEATFFFFSKVHCPFPSWSKCWSISCCKPWACPYYFHKTVQLSIPGFIKGDSLIQALLALPHLHKHSLRRRDCCKVLYLQTWTMPYPTLWCGRVRVASLWASSPRLRAVDGIAAVCLQSPLRTGLGLPLHP